MKNYEQKITLRLIRTLFRGVSSCNYWKHESFSNVRSNRLHLYGINSSIQLDHLEDTGVNERAILKLIFKKYDTNVEWVDMTQGRDTWLDLFGTLMNLWVS